MTKLSLIIATSFIVQVRVFALLLVLVEWTAYFFADKTLCDCVLFCLADLCKKYDAIIHDSD